MGTHQKLNYIHIFRALAIIIIVAGHCIGSKHPILGPFLNVILQDGTVLFVFIAGFLFQYLSDNFSYQPYLKKKFLNVICPYLTTSIIGIMAILLYSKGNPFATVSKPIQVFMFLTTGRVHNLPTWYIPMTSIFFLFAAILLKTRDTWICNRYRLLFWLLPFLIGISCLIPRFFSSNFVLPGMTAWQSYRGNLMIILCSTALFFPVYILGMFFAAVPEKIDELYHKRAWLWGLLIGGSVLSFYTIAYHIFPGRLLFAKIVLTLLLLGYLKRYDTWFLSHPRINHALGVVATYSFSIFFLHYYFIRAARMVLKAYLWPVVLTSPSSPGGVWLIYAVISRGITLFVAFFGSLFAAMLIKKLLEKIGIKHTRYFIGT